MFIGEYSYSIDDKKRLAIPPKFRAALGKKVVVTSGYDEALVVYPMKKWEAEADKLSKLPAGQADARGLARLMLGRAMDLAVDAAGRIIIPDYLKESAGLGKKVVMVGLYDRVEIWDEQKWSQYKTKTEKEVGNIAERLKEFGV
ncbi:MAG: division/cell wall cluster transcriptional repressor MraZ [Candidatus Wildermuthbacteria bacterium]|nr:division/cell wall cluster transcriptional repressor MraZ [Candidatus Wildermuthbacteria bacterium]